MNKRQIAILSLVGFVGYTGVYIFIYLWRSFRIEEPADLQYPHWCSGNTRSKSRRPSHPSQPGGRLRWRRDRIRPGE